MDHVLVSQRYLGTTMGNHLGSKTDAGERRFKDWYQKLCEVMWNSNHHGSDLKTSPEGFKPSSCTQHVGFFFPLMKKYLFPCDTEFINCVLKTVVDLVWFFLPTLDWLHNTKFFPYPIIKGRKCSTKTMMDSSTQRKGKFKCTDNWKRWRKLLVLLIKHKDSCDNSGNAVRLVT